jgi:hypothetical protein
MAYLTYDYTKSKPTCTYSASISGGRGNWYYFVNDILASGAFDIDSGHPVLLSAGSDNEFGTNDDVVNYK